MAGAQVYGRAPITKRGKDERHREMGVGLVAKCSFNLLICTARARVSLMRKETRRRLDPLPGERWATRSLQVDANCDFHGSGSGHECPYIKIDGRETVVGWPCDGDETLTLW